MTEPNRTPTGANNRRLPDWQLPPGVSRNLWDYAQADHIARDYDQTFAGESLFALDDELLTGWFAEPGRLVDLGCGTGRTVLSFAARGFSTLAVDLSPKMLEIVGQKAAAAGLSIEMLEANIVDLRQLANDAFHYATCLFSTLGMIRGSSHRQQCLTEAFRVLRPGGRLAVHVHNFWSLGRYPQGRSWLARHLIAAAAGRADLGDKTETYRGIPNFTLHFFRAGELRTLFRRAGFHIERWQPLLTQPARPLTHAWLCGNLRASGWLVVGQKRA